MGWARAVVGSWLIVMASAVGAQVPLSIDALRQAGFAAPWSTVRSLPAQPGFTAHLVAYRSAGLLVHALVATPVGPAPAQGFPVLVANHGYHPDPPRYGITAQGVDLRPGDYYRAVPALYTRAGFIVVMPDYRGHNRSEGLSFTQGPQAPAYYSEDVLALLPGLDSLDRADLRNVFMWGHSMGADVSLRAVLATARIRGASLWSGSLEAWAAEGPARGRARDADTLRDMQRQLPALQTPVMIQHAGGDATTDPGGSQRLAAELSRLGLRHEAHSLPGSDHFFQGDVLQQAVDRDVRFFRSLMDR